MNSDIIKTIIIEDEPPAANRLKTMLEKSLVPIDVVEIIDSVEGATDLFQKEVAHDLIFMDIQLGDGLSFEIFEEVSIKKPVIFTTAYDQYTLQAFKVNSVDYLLKPIDQEDLQNSLNQFLSYHQSQNETDRYSSHILNMIQEINKPQFKDRFLVKKGNQLVVVPCKEVSYFYSEDGYAHICTKSGNKYILDQTMDNIVNQVDPGHFFRISRKVILNIASIQSIHPYFNSRLKLKLDPISHFEVVVSRERVKTFKDWLDR
jgi:two-component system response regulator LytT